MKKRAYKKKKVIHKLADKDIDRGFKLLGKLRSFSVFMELDDTEESLTVRIPNDLPEDLLLFPCLEENLLYIKNALLVEKYLHFSNTRIKLVTNDMLN